MVVQREAQMWKDITTKRMAGRTRKVRQFRDSGTVGHGREAFVCDFVADCDSVTGVREIIKVIVKWVIHPVEKRKA